MATHAAQIPGYLDRSARRDVITLEAIQTIGAAGAIGALDSDDPGFTVAKNASTGTYDITYPKAPRGRLYWTIVSAVGTVKGAYLTAMDTTAGTAQLVTENGSGTATNPASGDKIQLMLRLEQVG